MFDYRFTRSAEEYTANLRKEALSMQLARATTSRLAQVAARTFRTWANRLEADPQQESGAGQAYEDAVARLLGEERPMRFTQLEKKGFFSKLFGG